MNAYLVDVVGFVVAFVLIMITCVIVKSTFNSLDAFQKPEDK